ncbi:9029_t:CDS:2 [Acaulospora morrowiae]|uniref:9029_t:CDS:1 n=1 Tax=Acaulospora morrowiae TaxID=94023 RepID=A0A9N8VG26_9GLOM|nr:9029_t:CDS:2 [Acaulospora morrowiae]
MTGARVDGPKNHSYEGSKVSVTTAVSRNHFSVTHSPQFIPQKLNWNRKGCFGWWLHTVCSQLSAPGINDQIVLDSVESPESSGDAEAPEPFSTDETKIIVARLTRSHSNHHETLLYMCESLTSHIIPSKQQTLTLKPVLPDRLSSMTNCRDNFIYGLRNGTVKLTCRSAIDANG